MVSVGAERVGWGCDLDSRMESFVPWYGESCMLWLHERFGVFTLTRLATGE